MIFFSKEWNVLDMVNHRKKEWNANDHFKFTSLNERVKVLEPFPQTYI